MNSVLDGPTLKLPNGGMSSPTLAVSRGRGFQASAVNFGPAPQINGRGFLAGHQGAMAIGQGLQDLGGSLGQISAHAAQAVNVRRIAEAGITTSAAQLDIAKAQAAEPDPNKWEGNARKMVGDITKGLVQNSDSPAVRQAIELHALEWGTNVIGQSKIAAYQKQFSDAGQTLGVLHGQQIESGDFTGAAATRQKMTPYVGPGSMEALRLKEVGAQQNSVLMQADTLVKDEGTAAIPKVKALIGASDAFTPEQKANKVAGMTYAATVEDVSVLATNDPLRAAELVKAHNLRGPDAVRVMHIAEQSFQSKRKDALDGYTESINMGQLPSPDELKANQFLSDYDKKLVLDYALQGPKNDPVGYASLFAEAANFKGDEGSPEYGVLAKRAAMALDGPLQSAVLGKLSETVKNKNPDELTRSMNEVYSLAKDDLQAGRFGTLHGRLSDLNVELPTKMRAEVDTIKESLMTPAEKERIAAEPGRASYIEGKARDLWYQRNHPKPADGESFASHIVDDSSAMTKAQRRYGDALATLEKWKKDNPKATPQQLRSQYDKSLVIQRAADTINPLLPDLNSPPPVDLSAIIKRYAPNPGN